jgi:hypothetical protein
MITKVTITPEQLRDIIEVACESPMSGELHVSKPNGEDAETKATFTVTMCQSHIIALVKDHIEASTGGDVGPIEFTRGKGGVGATMSVGFGNSAEGEQE